MYVCVCVCVCVCMCVCVYMCVRVCPLNKKYVHCCRVIIEDSSVFYRTVRPQASMESVGDVDRSPCYLSVEPLSVVLSYRYKH